jgi:LysR family transcriptional activator of glutamate synthase operon
MELLQLRYFLEVAATQHMTHSAQRLHIAQPSLSQAIRRLEDEVGVSLFARKGRNIVLTECGEFFREQLTPILERLDSLPAQLQEMADPEHVTIRLYVGAASVLVTEAIVAFQKEHPKANFQFLTQADHDFCDIQISSHPFVPEYTPRAGQFVCSEEIFLAVPDTPEYADKNRQPLSEFQGCRFISLMNSRQFRMICDRFCAQAGFIPHMVFESDNPDAVRNMIAANMGIGFWPAHTWGPIAHKKIRTLSVTAPVCRRSIHVVRNKNRTKDPAVNQFYLFLCHYFSEQLACQN